MDEAKVFYRSVAVVDGRDGVGDFIESNWPSLAELFPPVLRSGTVATHGGLIRMHTNMPEAFRTTWVHSRGGGRFADDASVPEGFCAVGQQVSDLEYVFAVWARDGRRFGFYDMYRGHCSVDCYGKAKQNLELALDRWRTTTDPIVVFSGPWGWYDPDRHKFERESDD
jgi:hypothetical protein